MANLTKYGSYSEEAADQEKEEMGKGSAEFFKPAAGENVVRFLPPGRGKSSPFVLVSQHYIEVPGEQSAVSFNCPRVMTKKFCPVAIAPSSCSRAGASSPT
jgi:hypothetical protein